MEKRLIYVFEGYTIIFSDSLNVKAHKHIAHQISVSLDECELTLLTDKEQTAMSFYLPPLKEHLFKSSKCHNVTILIDDEAILNFDLKSQKIESLCEEIRKKRSDQNAIVSLIKESELIKQSLVDERIAKVIKAINDTDDLSLIKANDMAQISSLSESRFLHLFKETVGIPFRKFILWCKLKRTIILFSQGANLTEIAHGSGFSDSAHMSKIFKASFGLNPKDILKNSQFIQE